MFPILLSQAPLTQEFLIRLVAFENQPMLNQLDFNDPTLSIESICSCRDPQCASIYLRRTKPWEDDITYSIFTSKGVIILGFLENGGLDIQALMYDRFPYKKELTRIANSVITPSSIEEKQALDAYFDDLLHASNATVVVD